MSLNARNPKEKQNEKHAAAGASVIAVCLREDRKRAQQFPEAHRSGMLSEKNNKGTSSQTRWKMRTSQNLGVPSDLHTHMKKKLHLIKYT